VNAVGALLWYVPVGHGVCGRHTRSASSLAEFGGSYSSWPQTVRLVHTVSDAAPHCCEMYW
jgi:hypothetical protein